MKSKAIFFHKFISIVLALFIVILEINVGTFEAISDENNQGVSVSEIDKTEKKKINIKTLYAVKENGNWTVQGSLSNVYLTYNVYADKEKKQIITGNKNAYSLGGTAEIELNYSGTVYVEVTGADVYGYYLDKLQVFEVTEEESTFELVVYRKSIRNVKVNLSYKNEQNEDVAIIDDNVKINIKHYFVNENGDRQLQTGNGKEAKIKSDESGEYYKTEFYVKARNYSGERYRLSINGGGNYVDKVVELDEDQIVEIFSEIAEGKKTGIDISLDKKIYDDTLKFICDNKKVESPFQIKYGSQISILVVSDKNDYLPQVNSFKSSKSNVATIDDNGNIKAVGKGKTTISASIKEYGIYKSKSISFVLEVLPLDQADFELNDLIGCKVNDKVELFVNGDMQDSSIEYSIENIVDINGKSVSKKNFSKYVKLYENNKLEFLKPCTFTVKAVKKRNNYNDKSVEKSYTVIKAEKSMFFEQGTDISVDYGSSIKNALTNDDNLAITYSSKDISIATVDENGNITGEGAGNTEIVAVLTSDIYTFGYDSEGKEINEIKCAVTVNKIEPLIKFTSKMINTVRYNFPVDISKEWFSGIKENAELSVSIDSEYAVVEENKIVVLKSSDETEEDGMFEVEFVFGETANYKRVVLAKTLLAERDERKIFIFDSQGNEIVDTLNLIYGEQKGYQLNYRLEDAEIDFEKSLVYSIEKVDEDFDDQETHTTIDDSGNIQFADKELGTYKVTLTKSAGSHYKESVCSIYVNVNMFNSDDMECSVSEPDYINGEVGWYNAEKGVTIIPPENYKISDDYSYEDNSWSDEYVYAVDGTNQSIKLYIRDENGGISEKIIKNIYMDSTPPTNLEIFYNSEYNMQDLIIKYITFGLVDKGTEYVTATIKAEDDISQIQGFYYYFDAEKNRAVNQANADGYILAENNSANITIDAEYRGKFKFTAVNGANLITEYISDCDNYIVDAKKPKVHITLLSDAECNNYNGKNYFNQAVTADIEVKEENFDSNKVSITINGLPLEDFDCRLNEEWSEDSDHITHRNSFCIDREGEFRIHILVTDELGQVSDVSEKIVVIDKTIPVISVSYNSESAPVNQKYYNSKRKANITVKETNFNCKDIVFELKATDVSGDNVSEYEKLIAMYQQKLSDNVNWQHGDDMHFITIDFEENANYNFSLNYIDLAFNKADEYQSQDFIVDSRKPENIQVNYSKERNVLEEIINKISFNTFYYRDGVSVSLSAEDMIAGIQSVDWIYQRQNNTSQSTVSTVKKHIDRKDMLFSSDSKKADIKFQLSADESHQYRGTISFTVYDMAGNISEYPVDESQNRIVVVDNISPTRIVEYSKPEQTIDSATFKSVNYDGHSEAGNYNLYYSDNAVITFRIKEANFYAEDVNINVNNSKISVNDWKSYGDEWIGHITLSEEGRYSVTMDYMDRSENRMKHYTSHTIIIDRTIPVVKVSYTPNKAKQVLKNNKFFDENQTATITVTERNFRSEDIFVAVTAKDINGKDITVPDYSSYLSNMDNWTKSGDAYTAKIDYTVNANYTFDIKYTDLALHSTAEYKKDEFTIDKSSPLDSYMTISYSKEKNFWESVLNGITFGYYSYQNNVTVTMTAYDDISGIDYIDWQYNRENIASTANVNSEKGRIARDRMSFSDDGKTATAVFTLTASQSRQYRGSILFTATDRSGNISTLKNDNKNAVIIVDNISPQRVVTFSKADRVVDKSSMNDVRSYDYKTEASSCKLYYNDKAKVTFEITEMNFYADDADIRVNDKKAYLNWTKSGDKWTGILELSQEGEYVITMDYVDRSTNRMRSYKSNEIVIDKTNPIIKVSYSPNEIVRTINDTNYYNANQTATIQITEHNFRADEVDVAVKAVDVSGNIIEVTDYMSYLKSRKSWHKSGDVYTAEIDYSIDANYTFDIAYTDLAVRQSPSYQTDTFTVDKTSPTALSISYSKNIFQNVLQNITFGYYNAAVDVTIQAIDNISPIEHFEYSYKKDENVSNVNAELLNQAIRNADIKRDRNMNTAMFRIPKSVLDSTHQYRGSVKFVAFDMSGNSSDMADKNKIIVDNIKPQLINVTYNNSVTDKATVAYYDGDINVTVRINEANFYSEDAHIYLYDIGRGVSEEVRTSWKIENGDVNSAGFSIKPEGRYYITVKYADRSGNEMDTYHSKDLVIDRTPPQLTVSNIKNDSSSKAETYPFVIMSNDRNLNQESFDVTLTAVMKDSDGNFAEKEISLDNYFKLLDEETAIYDIADIKDDAIYSLKCSVSDMSGNVTDKMVLDDGAEYEKVDFSINRKGSTFRLDEDSQKLISNYYINSVDNNIVIEEINVVPIVQYHVTVNGHQLTEGKDEDFTAQKNGGGDKWYLMRYEIKKELFNNENDYSIVVQSEDMTETVAYSDMKDLAIKFVVDKTPPVLTISGIEEYGRYQVESKDVVVIPSDGSKLKSLRILMLDTQDNPIKNADGDDISKIFDMSGDELLEYLKEHQGEVEFSIPECLNGKIVMYCSDVTISTSDKINETEKVISNVTVSPNYFTIIYADTLLFYSIVIGGAVVLGGIIALIVFMVKKHRK